MQVSDINDFIIGLERLTKEVLPKVIGKLNNSIERVTALEAELETLKNKSWTRTNLSTAIYDVMNPVAINVPVDVPVNENKPVVKIRRKRRTKAELEIARAEEEKARAEARERRRRIKELKEDIAPEVLKDVQILIAQGETDPEKISRDLEYPLPAVEDVFKLLELRNTQK